MTLLLTVSDLHASADDGINSDLDTIDCPDCEIEKIKNTLFVMTYCKSAQQIMLVQLFISAIRFIGVVSTSIFSSRTKKWKRLVS